MEPDVGTVLPREIGKLMEALADEMALAMIALSCHFAETFVEGCQAATEISGIWTCAYKKVAGEVVMEVGVPKCLTVAGSLDDPPTGVSHHGSDLPSQNGCAALRPSSYESSGGMSATSARCLANFSGLLSVAKGSSWSTIKDVADKTTFSTPRSGVRGQL